MPICFDIESAVLQPVEGQPQQVKANVRRVVNLVIPDLSLGGAERIVVDLIRAWRRLALNGSITEVNLFVLSEAKEAYRIRPNHPNVRVISLAHLRPTNRLRAAAELIHASGNHIVVTHLIGMKGLERMWRLGVRTMPVIHNSEERWNCAPAEFNAAHVPVVFAVCKQVATDLQKAGCKVPIHTIKHQLMSREQVDTTERGTVRKELGLTDSELLVGMVGKFKEHKRFPFAVEVLDELVPHVDAHLMIIGSQATPRSDGSDEINRVRQVADERGLSDRVHLLGSTRTIDRYYTAFDVYLNTSSCEGMSIAVMEAQSHRVPCVLSDVGGQAELITRDDILVPENASASKYAEAVLDTSRMRRQSHKREISRGLVPRLWSWVISHGTEQSPLTSKSVLFVTNNLGQGGAQRSLVNLLATTSESTPSSLCLLGSSYSEGHHRTLTACNIPVFSVDGLRLHDKVNTILECMDSIGIKTLCFWNTDARTKMLLSKVLQWRSTRIIDVSPGPKLFSALELARGFGAMISFSPEDYISRLDAFVSKYRHGGIPKSIDAKPREYVVIPNGVNIPICNERTFPSIRPANVSPEYALVATGRIVPAKMFEQMFAALRELIKVQPRATLTIVGKVEGDSNREYWRHLLSLYRTMGLEDAVYFLGENTSAKNHLHEFRAFLMLSRDQGCPNASLEAMACGLPVVANADGGTAEQVIDGRTGFLVDENNPEEIASRLNWIFNHPEEAHIMGCRGREYAASDFSISRMHFAYSKLLWSH